MSNKPVSITSLAADRFISPILAETLLLANGRDGVSVDSFIEPTPHGPTAYISVCYDPLGESEPPLWLGLALGPVFDDCDGYMLATFTRR